MLEFLKEVTSIDGCNVVHIDRLRDFNPALFDEDGKIKWSVFDRAIRPTNFIYLRLSKNSISFSLQRGASAGCEVTALIEAARMILAGFQGQSESLDRQLAISHLQCAYEYSKGINNHQVDE